VSSMEGNQPPRRRGFASRPYHPCWSGTGSAQVRVMWGALPAEKRTRHLRNQVPKLGSITTWLIGQIRGVKTKLGGDSVIKLDLGKQIVFDLFGYGQLPHFWQVLVEHCQLLQGNVSPQAAVTVLYRLLCEEITNLQKMKLR
jgi:hypothetical protein